MDTFSPIIAMLTDLLGLGTLEIPGVELVVNQFTVVVGKLFGHRLLVVLTSNRAIVGAALLVK